MEFQRWEPDIEDSNKENLLNSSMITSKPNKENYFNKPYSFPNYLGKNAMNIPFINPKINMIEFINPIKPDTWPSHTFTIARERIIADERTACMIKNIPNKYTSDMLIDFINETHFGMYDFFYLRIDFKNKCNVGYAFINFINNKAVLRFYDRINGKKWNNFCSSKIAELSYASIQGIENLKRKFRKSLVMQEDKAFRPKTFYTVGSLKGLEKNEFE